MFFYPLIISQNLAKIKDFQVLKKEKCLPEAQNCSKRRSDKKYKKPNVEMCK